MCLFCGEETKSIDRISIISMHAELDDLCAAKGYRL